MASINLFDPDSAMKALEDGTVAAIQKFFPIDGKKNQLITRNIYPGKEVDTEDTAGQKRARTHGRTWATPIYADIDLVDKETGKTIDSAKAVKLLNLPKLTRRYSFIVDGAERQADHQWRLKSGVYTRQRANGELEAQFNLVTGRGFRMDFHPEKGQFLLRYGTTNIQLLPVLKALGVSEDDIKQAWGSKAFEQLNTRKSRGDVVKLAHALDYKFVGNEQDAAKVIQAKFAETELLPDTTKLTLGKSFTKVTPETLLLTSKKLLNINRGTETTDNRDALQYKELWSVEDHIPERLSNSAKRIKSKIANNIDRKESVRDIITSDVFNVPVKTFFTSTSLSRLADQTNPIEMIGGSTRATIMGAGAIGNEQAVSMSAKMADPSSLGFIDSSHTPEGSSSGISTHLTLGVSKRGKDPTIKVWDVKKRALVEHTPAELAVGTVGFADQFDWKGATPVALKKLVSAIPVGGGDPQKMEAGNVDFILRNPKTMFSITTNMIPFLPSDQPNRAGMGTRHMEQTIALKHRETPLVQTASGLIDPKADTWEKIVGRASSHHAPVDGVVTQITPDQIVITGKDKKKHVVGLYDNYPLNEKKSYVNSEPVVKQGDQVSKDDLIADTTHSVSGNEEVLVLYRGNVSRVRLADLKFRHGMKVLALDCDNLVYEWKILKDVFAHSTTDPLVEVKTYNGRTMRVTAAHSCLTVDADGNIVKIRPKDMVPGYTLVPVAGSCQPAGFKVWDITSYAPKTVAQKNATKYVFTGIKLTRSVGFLIGVYLAEGDVSVGKYIRIAATVEAIREHTFNSFSELGLNPRYATRTVEVGCAQLARAFQAEFGAGNLNKMLPGWVMAGPIEFRQGVIDGAWSGDSTLYMGSGRSHAQFQVDSEKLAVGVQSLLLGLGISASFIIMHSKPGCIHLRTHPNGHTTHYRLTVGAADVINLPRLTHPDKELNKLTWTPHAKDGICMAPVPKNLVHGALRRKHKRGYCGKTFILREAQHPRVRALADGEVLWDLVESITAVPPEEIVYDLTVGEHETFVLASGLTVHNTKNGTLAMGVNLRVGYMDWHGLNFEDAIIISETAAKRLTSLHQHKPRVYLDRGMGVGLARFRANFPGVISTTNAAKLDEDGVIKKGQTVNPGDVIMAVLKKNEPSPEQVMLKGIHKALARPFKDSSVTWDSSVSGTVTDVVRNGNEIVSYITTEEPAGIGDKLCFAPDHEILTSAGWVPVADITCDMHVASLILSTGEAEYLQPVAVYQYQVVEQLVHVETETVSMLVTTNHKIPAIVVTSGTQDGPWGFRDAVELVDKAHTLLMGGVLGEELVAVNMLTCGALIKYVGLVHCVELPRNHTLYTRRNGKVHWSGNSARHGNKGVISTCLPDNEMPKNKDGVPLDIILSPSGIPGRLNPGQVLETMLGKAAEKGATTYAVDNFNPDSQHKIIHVHGFWRNIHTDKGLKRVWVHPYDRDVGYQELVKEALKQNGIEATDELIDPQTGKSFGKVLVGKQYFIKLMHQGEKGLVHRSFGFGNDYDANMTPKGGGHTGAGRYSELGTYAMLAHGSVNELRDALSYKSDRGNADVWNAIQTGQPLPAPKTSFAYEKFLAYLHTVGLDVEKQGNELHLLPFTDKQIKELSSGELKHASKVLRGKDLRPEPGGLFDAKITGGPGGKKWSDLRLVSPVPNPIFEKAITSLLGISGKEYDEIITGNMRLGGKIGPGAIVAAIQGIRVDRDLKEAQAELKTARKSSLNSAYKRVKYLSALQRAKMSASDAYVTKSVAVIPPVFRPITMMEGGDLNVDGVNRLYRDIALLNDKITEGEKTLPESAVAPLRRELYEAVVDLAGTTSKAAGATSLGEEKPPGILTILAGKSSPKESFVHTKLLDRRQDLSLRAVITPDQTLGLDQISIPREGAFSIFKPFIVKELVQQGFTPLSAREEVDRRSPLAKRALEVAITKRPVFFKRDPVLHKFGIMAFWAKLNDGHDIRTHPLLSGGFNFDYDGDKMAVFVPVTNAAVEEAKRMLPSNNLFNFSDGKTMYQPSLGGQLGLYLMTHFGKNTTKRFDTLKEAADAADHGDISMTDIVTADGKRTTAGRIKVYSVLPEEVRTDRLLTDESLVMGKKNLQDIMHDTATKVPKEFPTMIDALKNLGFGHVHNTGFSFEANDFDTLHEIRDAAVKKADKTVAALHTANMSAADKEKKTIEAYTEATAEMNKNAKVELDKRGSKLYVMNKAGVKPAWSQVQQLVLAPMLLQNAAGRTIAAPVTKSYSEGLDSADYWIASAGARKGLIDKVQSVQKPGVLSKQLINATVPYSVTEHDCGTVRGIALDTMDPDLIGRVLAKETVVGKDKYATGTVLTPNVLDRFKQGKLNKVLARSVLKCQAKTGLCAVCYGELANGKFPTIGTNLGVLAGQSIGERGTQLSLKNFHTGGLAGISSKASNALDHTLELLRMPETLPDAATLSEQTGKVESVHKSPLGGWQIKVGQEEHYAPGGREVAVKVGDQVTKGDKLTDGSVDPRKLLELTDIDHVQRYMSDELHDAYSSEGVKRRNSEVVIKALTNLGNVIDPGDSDEFIRGDNVSLSYVDALNKEKGYQNPIRVEPILKGLETLPLDRSTDWLARLQYRKLKESLTRGATEGWVSQLHGMSPIPGLVHTTTFGVPEDKTGKSGPY